MKILAFVQLGVFRSCLPIFYQQRKEAYTDPDDWRAFIRTTASGKRLEKAFNTNFDKIMWRQTNPDRPEDPKQSLDYDIGHVRKCIQLYRPDIIVALGASAEKAVNTAVVHTPISMELIYGPHPSPKLGAEGMMKLVMAAAELNTYIK